MKYKLIFVAILLFGAFGVASAEISDDYGGSRSIRLREGWNLVTAYTVDLDALGRSDIELKDIRAVFIYDRYSGEYIRVFPQLEEEKIKKWFASVGDPEKGGDIGEYGGFVNMSAWVYSEKDQTVKYYSVDGPLPHKYVNIRPGWNF